MQDDYIQKELNSVQCDTCREARGESAEGLLTETAWSCGDAQDSLSVFLAAAALGRSLLSRPRPRDTVTLWLKATCFVSEQLLHYRSKNRTVRKTF